MEEIKNDRNELNDILIRNENQGGNKMRNVLLIIAALVLVAIIAILAMRIVENSATPKDEPKAAKEIKKEEPKTVITQSQSQAPEADEASKRLEEIIKNAKESRLKKDDESTKVADEVIPSAAIVEEKIEEAPKVVIKKEEPKVVAEKPKEQTKVAEVEVSKPVVEKTPQKVAKPSGSYFVQIESLTKEPDSSHIKELKNKGFDVVVKQKTIDGKTYNRIHVGPYKTREEAAAVLPKIKQEISPEAFVIQD